MVDMCVCVCVVYMFVCACMCVCIYTYIAMMQMVEVVRRKMKELAVERKDLLCHVLRFLRKVCMRMCVCVRACVRACVFFFFFVCVWICRVRASALCPLPSPSFYLFHPIL